MESLNENTKSTTAKDFRSHVHVALIGSVFFSAFMSGEAILFRKYSYCVVSSCALTKIKARKSRFPDVFGFHELKLWKPFRDLLLSHESRLRLSVGFKQNVCRQVYELMLSLVCLLIERSSLLA
jgi:hypothetical protein